MKYATIKNNQDTPFKQQHVVISFCDLREKLLARKYERLVQSPIWFDVEVEVEDICTASFIFAQLKDVDV